MKYHFNHQQIAPTSPHLAVENALQQHRLWLLGAHIRVAGLFGHENATDLAQLLVHLPLETGYGDLFG